MLGKLIAAILALPLAILLAVAVSALVAWPVQHLYNFLAPGELWDISFKQAWAFTLLCRLLIGK